MNNQQSRDDNSWLPFQNRVDELHEIIHNIAIQGGDRLILLIAMPEMGKSCLLKHLDGEVISRSSAQHHVSYVNLGAERPEIRTDLKALLAQLFQGQDWGHGPDEPDPADQQGYLNRLVSTTTQIILRSNRPWLVKLDNAELMSKDTAGKMRRALCSIIRELRTKNRDHLLSFIAASRVEIPAFKGIIPEPGFRTIILTHFDDNVISKTLEKIGTNLGLQQSTEYYQQLGKWLWRETEGLPALLVKYLKWINDNLFVFGDDFEETSRKLFEKLARPYIENKLLALDTVVPGTIVNHRREEVRPAFSELVLGTSIFRLVTRSHLTLMAHQQPLLSDAMQTIQTLSTPYDAYDMYGLLPVVKPVAELWYVPYTTVRRLYFKYRYLSVEDQIRVHRQAQEIYANWADIRSGSDQIRFLIEQFWHEVEKVRLSPPPDPLGHITEYVDRLLDPHLLSDEFDYQDLHKLFRKLAENDKELQSSLEELRRGFSTEFLTWLHKREEKP
ncbi:MAG TPA: hypothetical protein VJ302_33980 [Blastocatellia bacterium]|nr:hypothetical protein [Blastocatellia bacterium]